MKKITLAGGCFWGVQAYFNRVIGVTKTQTGYIDGRTKNPSYQDVLNGSGHAEALYIEYDAAKTDLKTLLDHYFNIIDPTVLNRQGNDVGLSYRTGIYTYENQDILYVNQYIKEIQNQYKKPIVTDVKEAKDFYPAERYHQNYLDKNPGGYCHINLRDINKIQK
ncbi:MAG TPA: peptide-methionine (S)-S-oxide reductase MsrA [Candidatus Izemoplasmatales bacterium]|nr:peptide-methionine (S)-S-oxide reductase MsrA [Candidatus Izemoplasmatales bacterium]